VTRAVAARGAVSAAAVSAVGQRWAGLAAWSMAVAAGAALGLALAVERRQPAFDLSSALYGAAILCFAVVGAFVAQRRPANPLGWLFAAVGLLGLAQLASYQVAYATFGTGTVAVPGALWLGWYSSWAFPPVAALFVVVIPLLFPTGRPPSARAGHILTITAATVGVTSVAGMLRPWDRSAGGLLEDPDVVLANPVALEGAAWLGTVQELGMVVLGGMALATIAAMVGRYRRSGPIEKLQLKWFLYAVAVVVTYVIGSILGEGILGGDPPAVVFIIGPFFLAGVPISAAFAILRYRLYDIDRIISRTVAYTGVTAVLGAVYAGAVVLLGQVLTPLGQGSQLTVAASTLVVAALFGPLRRAVQSRVDRRFNRARYDAQRTVDDFAARLRGAVDLDQLSRELIDVVDVAVAPGSVQLWLAGEQR
jgi:hypothetical protein